jgi:gas vesicle structural protein
MTVPFRSEEVSLVEVLDRVIHTGVVLRGDLVLSLADIDLIYVRLDLLLMSVKTAQRLSSSAVRAVEK